MPHLSAVPAPGDEEPPLYSELSETEQAAILRNSIKELEQKLFVVRANASMQARLIGAPISESRRNTAKRALREFNDQIPDLQISIKCLRDQLGQTEERLPAKEDDGDESDPDPDHGEGADEGDHPAARAQAGARRARPHPQEVTGEGD